MKYVQPIGAPADAPYVDANPAAGIEGSAVSAPAIEHPMREIEAAITAAGLTPSATDLTQLAQAMSVRATDASTRYRSATVAGCACLIEA